MLFFFNLCMYTLNTFLYIIIETLKQRNLSGFREESKFAVGTKSRIGELEDFQIIPDNPWAANLGLKKTPKKKQHMDKFRVAALQLCF